MTNIDHDGERDRGLLDRLVDDETPAGDTPEAHDEISPHDLPPGHPMRAEVARRAAQAGGTTTGSD
ncbi:MAG TPA: hypothetical protein VG165_12170 [Solirubrobacteraceae bacterium]|jgi:hypothetical protein|nr:hypothetical protein [Solirubrobacteraceae bacterium]